MTAVGQKAEDLFQRCHRNGRCVSDVLDCAKSAELFVERETDLHVDGIEFETEVSDHVSVRVLFRSFG